MPKNVLLKLNFQGKNYLDAYFLIYILTIYCECVIFYLFCRGIRINIPILAQVQKGHISKQRNGHNSLKNVLLKHNFQREIHLYAKCLFDILSLRLKSLLCEFFSCGLRMQISILTCFQKGTLAVKKMVIFCVKMYFLSLIS